MEADIQVEVVFATADQQQLIQVTLPAGATVYDAITNSSIARYFPEYDLDVLQVGVWGRLAARDRVLSDGDRVELYRALELDPRDARRQLALLGQTMSGRSAE